MLRWALSEHGSRSNTQRCGARLYRFCTLSFLASPRHLHQKTSKTCSAVSERFVSINLFTSEKEKECVCVMHRMFNKHKYTMYMATNKASICLVNSLLCHMMKKRRRRWWWGKAHAHYRYLATYHMFQWFVSVTHCIYVELFACCLAFRKILRNFTKWSFR